MDLAYKIIDMFQNHMPIEEIEKQISWENLSLGDYEKLFAEADRMQDGKNGIDLLGLMYKAVKDRDFWQETRILAAVIARPDPDVERAKLHKRMGFCLEQIRSSLTRVSKSDPLQLRYRRYLCDYVFLSARILEETGDIDRALTEYTAAQKAYTEYNFRAAAMEVDEPIARLHRLKRQGDQLINLQSLADRRAALEKEIAEFSAQSQQKSQLLEEISIQLKNKETELLNLNLIIEELELRLENKQNALQNFKEETTTLESRRKTTQDWLEQVERDKTTLVERVIALREEAQQLDTRVAQSSLKLSDRLAALQAQIDLKASELKKIENTFGQKAGMINELEQTIAQHRDDLAMIEEAIHSNEAYLVELSRRRADIENETSQESTDEPAAVETVDQPPDDLGRKLDRYKKSLKASRTRKKNSTQDSPANS